MYITNTVSAFWHGFYPGYYISFVKASLEIDMMRRLRAKARPMVTSVPSFLSPFSPF